ADRNRSHWSTSKTPSYTKSVSWQHHLPFLNTDINVADVLPINYLANFFDHGHSPIIKTYSSISGMGANLQLSA
ncbi:hypothetical protein, partial [Enterobacter kobei]|uniref:hypothetical protein n=1 Tax=Enterobacter kobei TaxID=208224 RepID=UPI00298C0879